MKINTQFLKNFKKLSKVSSIFFIFNATENGGGIITCLGGVLGVTIRDLPFSLFVSSFISLQTSIFYILDCYSRHFLLWFLFSITWQCSLSSSSHQISHLSQLNLQISNRNIFILKSIFCRWYDISRQPSKLGFLSFCRNPGGGLTTFCWFWSWLDHEKFGDSSIPGYKYSSKDFFVVYFQHNFLSQLAKKDSQLDTQCYYDFPHKRHKWSSQPALLSHLCCLFSCSMIPTGKQ